MLIDGPIDVVPLPDHLHVTLVDGPTTANAASSRSGGVDQQGNEALDPSVDRDVVDLNAAF
ncbi:MAG: hypothetical protein ACI8TP_003048 [Acidimicrobiales bacterium]|jgi:hypothetical protein